MLDTLELYVRVFLVFVIGYFGISVVINIIFLGIFNLGFKIKYKLPKKYEGRITPIYKIKKLKDNNDLCCITKFELKQIETDSVLFMLIPIPLKIFKYRYVEIYWTKTEVNNKTLVNNVYQLSERSYDDFVKICEDRILEEKRLEDKENQKKLDEENSKKSFEERINKVFSENYFDK